MSCKEIYINVNSISNLNGSLLTMVDDFGNYVFYNLDSSLLTGSYSVGNTSSSYRLTSFTQSGYWTECGMANDLDANAFIIAANITNETQKNAIRKLVTDLKSANIWTKFKAIYPMVGGSSFSCKFNLKDPRDLDAAFRLGFTGSATFSSTGIQFAGVSNAYTYLVPIVELTQNDTHISYYSRTDNAAGYHCEMGVNSAGTQDFSSSLSMYVRYANGSFISDHYSFPNSRISVSSGPTATSAGYYISSRISSNDFRVYKNSTQESSSAGNAGTIPDKEIYIGALNDFDNPVWITNRECAFATIGYGLDPTQVTNLYNAVNTFQTTLGRNV